MKTNKSLTISSLLTTSMAVVLMSSFTACSCPIPEPVVKTVEVPRITPCKVPLVERPQVITYSQSETPSAKVVKVYENYLNMKHYANSLERSSKVCQ